MITTQPNEAIKFILIFYGTVIIVIVIYRSKMTTELLILIILTVLLFSSCQLQKIVVDCRYGNDTLCMCNHDISIPCKTLHTALELAETMRHNDSTLLNTTIQINSGNYSYNTTSSRTLSFSNVTITGNGSDVTIVECNNSGTGFGFINVSNTSISRLTLSGCGQLRNSTTMNTSNSIMLFRAALYFVNVVNVTIDDVTVSDSIGMGVAMYDVTGDVMVYNSMFRNNRVPSHELTLYPGGGGFSVEFSYCKPGSNYIPSNCNNINERANYLFYNCTFNHNTASTLNRAHTSYSVHTFGTGNQQFGRGGGLSVFFKGHSIQNVIKICNCVFDRNYAVWGGGYHSDIVDYSTGNVLTLEDCEFTDNHCNYDNALLTTGTGGGGARIAFLFSDPRSKVNNNSVQFINCRFQFNMAYFGGGLSCGISKENNVIVASNSLELVDCTWAENVARTGSGVDIISHAFPHGVSPVVTIVNCNFTANNNSYSNMAAFPLGIGALYADNTPVNFSGNCIFTENKDSAIAGIDTHFMFSNNTFVMFINNSGWHGAGMALLGNAYFIVYHNTSVQFINNRAVTKGGAIYYINSGQKDFVSTQRCLLYYYDLTVQNHSNWATKFYFSENNALLGRSIYCTTLLPCIWDNPPMSITVNEEDILQVFNWSGVFHYSNKYNRSEEIATDTLNISIDTNRQIKIPPGQIHPLNITPLDDRGQRAYPVIIARNKNIHVTTSSVIVNGSHYFVKVHGSINSNKSLHIHSFNNRPYVGTINVMVDSCPPGFYYSHNGKACKCPIGTSEKFYGITDCDNDDFVVHLDAQFWAGYVNFKGKEVLMTSDCPRGYCSSSRLRLPNNSSRTALEELVCSHHRTGSMCGKCQNGYFVCINSPFYHCGRCNDTLSKHGALILIVSKYVPLTVMMCFIIFFDISLVDGPLNSFILFCQILVTLRVYGNGKVGPPTKSSGLATLLDRILIHCYDIWNLRFFEFLLPPFCIFQHNTTMVSIMAEYTPAFYVLLFCVICFFALPWISQKLTLSRLSVIRNCILKINRIFIRMRHRWSIKNSVIHSLTTFLVLSYARITLTTFKILAPMPLYGPGGQNSHYMKRVVFYDGTMSYFGPEHLPYSIVAIFIFIIFVLLPPLLLLSYPLLPVLLTRLGVEHYWIVKKLIINPLSKCVPIFDAFQSCYKDEYRFFAGLLFVYRVASLAIYAFSPNTSLNYVWIQLFFLLVLFIHCVCQPYKNKWHNFNEAFTFTILASVSVISSHRLFEDEAFQTETNVYFWIQMVLLSCPLLYFIGYVTYKVTKWLQPCIKPLCSKTCCCIVWRNNNNYNLVNSCQFPARLEDNSDNHFATSESDGSESIVTDDEDQEERHEQDDDDDDDVEMIYPVEINSEKFPSNDVYSGRNWVTQ